MDARAASDSDARQVDRVTLGLIHSLWVPHESPALRAETHFI